MRSHEAGGAESLAVAGDCGGARGRAHRTGAAGDGDGIAALPAAILTQILEKTGVKENAAFHSSKEYKRMRVQYFTLDVALWQREHERKPGA
jgi:hypothetical protein